MTNRSGRAEFAGAELQSLPEDRCLVRVTLARQIGPRLRQSFVGKAEAAWSPWEELRCSAIAALQALARSFGAAEETFVVQDIKTVDSFDGKAVLVAVAARHEEGSERLVGFCEVRDDPRVAAAKAALNATNRFVEFRLSK